jgi:hypothetical protein
MTLTAGLGFSVVSSSFLASAASRLRSAVAEITQQRSHNFTHPQNGNHISAGI